jgi:hypothetical protein
MHFIFEYFPLHSVVGVQHASPGRLVLTILVDVDETFYGWLSRDLYGVQKDRCSLPKNWTCA